MRDSETMQSNGVLQPETRNRALQLSDALLLLFFWTVLFVLSTLGMLQQLSGENLGLFALTGIGTLLICALAAVALAEKGKNPSLVVFFAFLTLVCLPAITLVLNATERLIILDLYFVLLIASPAFLWIWTWKLQALAGAFASVAVAALWIPTGSWFAVHSIVLVVLSAFLASFVQILRARDSVQRELALYHQSIKSLDESSQRAIADRGWNVALLQLGMILLLIFVDIAFLRDAESFPFLAKVYGLLGMVIAALFVKANQRFSANTSIIALTLASAFVLSLARTGYSELHAPIASLPIVYLAFAVTLVPWTLSHHIGLVWTILVVDFVVKALFGLQGTYSFFERFGAVALQYQAEIALLTVGSFVSVLMVKLFKHQRVGVLTSSDGAIGLAEEVAVLRSRAARSANRKKGVVAGLLVFGVIASSAASQMLSQFGQIGASATIITWIAFFILWALLVNSERSNSNENQFWMIAAFQALLLFLWPSLLLFIVPDASYMWLFWPIAVITSLGLVPWRLKELLSLFAVFSVVGVELVYDFQLDVLGVALCVSAPLLGVLFSLQLTRRVKERHCLSSMPRELEIAESPSEALVLFASYVQELFASSYCVVSVGEKDLLMLQDGSAFYLEKDSWPVDRYVGSMPMLRDTPGSFQLKVANWLPSDFTLFDDRFGLLNQHHGFVVEIQARTTTDSDSTEDSSERAFVFLASRFPFFEWMKTTEVSVAETLAAITAGSLARFKQEDTLRHREEEFEKRSQEREYELGSLVHDINNTVQDLTLLCESILERARPNLLSDQSPSPINYEEIEIDVERIANIARSVATVVSDAKRKRELERLSDLRPREMVEVTKVLTDIFMFARIRAERKRISVKYESPDLDEIWIRISVREHLETILRNLLNNAMTYSEAGSDISLALVVDDDWVSISVGDNGPGLREDELESIFISGFRGRSSVTSPGGLGLGLAQSRRVAESAGGSLTVQSEGEGKGAIFTVRLPRQTVSHIQPPDGDWALLVDDQPTLTDFYSRLAKAMNILPYVADSVDVALGIVDRLGKPTLVISDIHLGGSSGLDLVRELRGRFGTMLPILVVSGLSDDDVADQARDAGASDFVAKPIGQRALYARIQSLLPSSISVIDS